MRPRSRWIAAVTLVQAFLAACSETPPTGVQPPTSGPLLQISDGANSGREGFYFLSPLVSSPGSFAGTFDAKLTPEVRVCQLAGSLCGTVVKVFTTATAEPVEIVKQTYSVNWSTKNNPSSLTTAVKYRIEVRVGAAVLGFADLAFVKTNKEAGTIPAGTVAAVLGSPLTIKFRIETRTVGSVTVTPATASISLPGNQAFSAEVRDLHGTVVPNAPVIWASSNPAAATVSDASGPSATATGVALGSTVVTATVGGVTGSANVTVIQKPNAEDDSYAGTVGQLLAPGATAGVLTLIANDGVGSPAATISSVSVAGTSYPLPLPQAGVAFAGGLLQVLADGNFSVSTQLAGQFTFRYTLTNGSGSDDALVTVTMGSGAPAAMIALSDQDQTATVGTAVALPPSVRVVDAYNNPVPGVSVAFLPGSLGSLSGATVTGSPATTDANGVATVGSWTLATKAGLYQVRALAGALIKSFATTAVAGPPAKLALLLLPTPVGPPPESITLSGGGTQRFKAVLADSYGNLIPSIDQVVNFNSSDQAVAAVSPSVATIPFAITTVTARYLTTDQNVEIHASLADSPSIQGVATITVVATDPPPAPKNDSFVIEPCLSLGCQLTSFLTGNVLSDNGFGADELGNPPAVITRFGGAGLVCFSDCPVGSLDNMYPVGATLASGLSSSTRVTLAADGTVSFSRTIGLDGSIDFVFSFQYEVQNIWGTSTATVTISRGVSGSVSATRSVSTQLRSTRVKTP